MKIDVSPALFSAAADQPSSPDRKDLAEVAQQFESLLLSELLKSARGSSKEGWLGTGEDESAASVMEFAEEQFARTIAAGGGLGIARMVVSALRADETKQTPGNLNGQGVSHHGLSSVRRRGQ